MITSNQSLEDCTRTPRNIGGRSSLIYTNSFQHFTVRRRGCPSSASVTDLATDVSSCVTLSLAYVRLIRDDPNDKHKFLAGSSLDISTRLELSIYVFPRGLNRSGGVTGYNPVAHNWKSIFGSTTTSYLTEY